MSNRTTELCVQRKNLWYQLTDLNQTKATEINWQETENIRVEGEGVYPNG